MQVYLASQICCNLLEELQMTVFFKSHLHLAFSHLANILKTKIIKNKISNSAKMD